MARHETGKAKTLSTAQIRAVLSVLNTTRDVAMFLLSAKAALRAVEIAGLQWRHVRGDVLELTPDITKGGKPRIVPIGRAMRDALDAHRGDAPDHQNVFPNRHTAGRSLSANAVSQWFRHLYVERMGWTGYSSHSGRRTAITQLARSIVTHGGSLRDVQDIAGHSSLKTTQIYIEVSSDAKRRAMDAL